MARGNYTNKAAQSVAEFAEEKAQDTVVYEVDTTKKGGRPSKGEVHKVSLSIPVELYEGVEFGSFFFKGNKTAYINSLIKKDLEHNLEKYREFKSMVERQ